METLDIILNKAEEISKNDHDEEAARFLAAYRKAACDAIKDDISKVSDLLAITTAQVDYLNRADMPDKGCAIAEWFLHTLQHLDESSHNADLKCIKFTFNEAFSRFFVRYARSLRDLSRFEDMRLAIRTSLDMTRAWANVIIIALYLYMPLLDSKNQLEEDSKTWFLKRCAEFLATLDFNGLHDSDFRSCLDNFQYILRDPDKQSDTLNQMIEISKMHPDDITMQALCSMAAKLHCA